MMTLKSEILRKINTEIERISDKELTDIGGGLESKKESNINKKATLVQRDNSEVLSSGKEFVNC